MHTKPPTPAVFQILLALVEGERHGYAIMQAVAAETENVFTMGPGTLYGALKRMLAAGLVEESGERPDPEMNQERRKYYRISANGRRVAAEEAKRLEALVASARAKLLLGNPSMWAS